MQQSSAASRCSAAAVAACPVSLCCTKVTMKAERIQLKSQLKCLWTFSFLTVKGWNESCFQMSDKVENVTRSPAECRRDGAAAGWPRSFYNHTWFAEHVVTSTRVISWFFLLFLFFYSHHQAIVSTNHRHFLFLVSLLPSPAGLCRRDLYANTRS